MSAPEAGALTPELVAVLINSGPLTVLHPALMVLQHAWEAADPISYMPRVAARPLPGRTSTSLFVPVGQGDSFFPEPIFDAAAIAYHLKQAGTEHWPALQQGLSLAGQGGIEGYPVSGNVAAGDGYTGVVAQYQGDGLADPHAIFMQLPELRYQWSCFFRSHKDSGEATVFAPADPAAACP